MKTSEFIFTIGAQVLERYGFEITGNRHIDCPLCGGVKKFRIHESDQHGCTWICTCGSGSVLDLIVQTSGRAFKDVCDEIDREFGNTDQYVAKKDNKKPVEEKFASLQKIEGSQAELYLASRGITTLPEFSVRYSNAEYHKEAQVKFGAMYAIASDHRMRAAQVHLTYLKDAKKAGDPPRKMFKVTGSENFAIKMFNAGSCLGIGEGIETSLSASQIDSVPVWATLNTSIMKKFRAPRQVKTLIVYADNDRHGAGLAAAFECANKNLLSKNNVTTAIVKWTDSGDWNDWLHDHGRRYEWKLTR